VQTKHPEKDSTGRKKTSQTYPTMTKLALFCITTLAFLMTISLLFRD